MHHSQDPRFSYSSALLFSIFNFLITLVSIDDPADNIVTSSLPLLLLLSFSTTFAVFLWIQLNAISFLNSYCDHYSFFFLHTIIIWAVFYKIYAFTSITPNTHINNSHHHLRFIIQCWKFYEFQIWLATSTEFMLLL